MIDITSLSKQFGGKYLFNNANAKINPSDKIALVGSNGTGKSTLLKMICGIEEPESGKIQRRKNLRIGYLPQEFISSSKRTIIDEIKTSLTHFIKLEEREQKINKALLQDNLDEKEHEKLIHELGDINHFKELWNYYESDSNIEKVLIGLGFKITDFNRTINEFSGGWIMRLELAKILLNENDLILLDEPTNHLDIDSLNWLKKYLASYRGAILMVSHDRDFVNFITQRTLEIFANKLNFYNGKYDAYLKFKEERDAQLISDIERQKKKRKEIESFVERFRYKATKAKQVQSRIKALEKFEKIEAPDHEKEIEIRFPDPPRSGNIPLKLINISKIYDAVNVFEKINFNIERDDKIAFVGPNGAGKTTLSKIIAGRLVPSSGEVVFSSNTVISYYSQETTENMNLENDILEEVYSSTEQYTPLQLRSLLGAFLFSDDDVFKKIKVLSGGEKSRVALAKILLTKANLIVLDEPTNHLDFQSKRILQKALMEFSGTLIIVSHDIDFIRPITNKILDIRDGKTKFYYGGIDYYQSKRLEELEGGESKKGFSKTNENTSKKDQKRIEAEKRQEKYKATKKLKQEIAVLEEKIEDFEGKKEESEKLLSEPEIYKNGEKSAEISRSLAEIKKKLSELYSTWEEKSFNLEEIESSFE